MKRLFVALWRLSRNDFRLLWFAAKHPSRPGWLIPAVIALTLYALSPLNLVIPVLGMVDDLVLVPLVLHWLLKLLPQQIRRNFNQNAGRSPISLAEYREAAR